MPAGKQWIFDTSVYIAAIRAGLDSRAAVLLQERLPRTHLASVVSAELRAGALTEVGRRAVHDLTFRARRVGRVVTPTASGWERAGDILGRIRRNEPRLRSKVPTLWNDLLISISARQIGATVVTTDAGDFWLLQRYLGFDLEVFS